MKIKYYLMSGVDRSRDQFMIEQFDKANIKQEDVMWIKKPNKDELSQEFINKIYKFKRLPNNNNKLKLGQISITYKHFLSYKDMIENGIELGVIMEDNIEFRTNNFPKILNEYLNQLPEDWDILYEGDTLKYNEKKITNGCLVYKKSIKALDGKHFGGGTNAANCYILPIETAKKFYNDFLPFYNVTDHYMNDLLRKYNLNTYWAVPPKVHRIRRKSTAIN
jgi:hypothetical protein